MRVLQVIGAMDRGGAETVIMNLYRAMDRDKVQFDFLVHEQRRCDYDDEIESLGGRIYRIPRFNILNAHEYRKCCRKHFEEHPEHRVVHGHIGSSAAIYLEEAKRAGCATVLHSHAQNHDPFPRQQVFNFLAKRSLKWADYFLACSPEAGRDRFGSNVVASSNYRVLMNGLDVPLYCCDDASHLAAKGDLGFSDSFVVGHVGRFVEVKNHAFLLKVFARILESRPNAVLLLLGRGPLEDEIRKMAVELGISEKVVFCGVRGDVHRYLKAMDLFILPSELEGLALAGIEAQAAGAPCVFSTGVPEIAAAARCALRLDLDLGEEAWAKRALEWADKAPERSLGSVEVARAGYDIRDTAAWLADLYENLAAR